MKPTQLCVAVHEAGHAVARLANPPHPEITSLSIAGLPVGILGLVDTAAMWQPYMAVSQASPETIDLWRELAWKDVIFHLAGPIAELRWRRHSRLSILFVTSQFRERCLENDSHELGSDLDRVRARLLWAYPDDPHQAFNDAWEETEELVAKHWRTIVSLGRTLLKKGRIEGEDLLAMRSLG